MNVGDKVGFLTIDGFEKGENSKNYILCTCDCGKKVRRYKNYMIKAGPQQSCGCMRQINHMGTSSKNFRGMGDISMSFFQRMLHGAKHRDIEFQLNIEYVWDLFLKQNRKCSYTEEILKFHTQRQNELGLETTASLDRIDSSKGYFEGNVQWVHKHINAMKNDKTHDEFVQLCTKIYNYKILQITPPEPTFEIINPSEIKLENKNYLTKLEEFTKNGRKFVKAQCECGKIIERRLDEFEKKQKCKSCGCKTEEFLKQQNILNRWKGVGETGANLINNTERDRDGRRKKLEVSLECLWDIFLKQNKRCPFIGERLIFGSRTRKVEGTASLDRIDQSKGYIEGNVRWLHKDVNWARKILTDDRFLELCVKVVLLDYDKKTKLN